MERRIISWSCSLTGGECPNKNCRYTGTGFGCLYQGVETKRPYDKTTGERDVIDARTRVHDLSIQQARLRAELKELIANNPENPRITEIRGQMMTNRLGKSGLRALNSRLYGRGWKSKR